MIVVKLIGRLQVTFKEADQGASGKRGGADPYSFRRLRALDEPEPRFKSHVAL